MWSFSDTHSFWLPYINFHVFTVFIAQYMIKMILKHEKIYRRIDDSIILHTTIFSKYTDLLQLKIFLEYFEIIF